MDVSQTAKQLIAAGFSVIPCKGDTVKGKRSKEPCMDSWEGYQKEKMYDRHVPLMFKENNHLGVVCGQISGNLECIDFDNHFGNIEDVFREYISYEDVKLIIETYGLFIEKTKSGGRHLVYRCHDPIPAGTHLAMDYDKEGKPKCFIETRGEGQYFICAPSGGYEQTYPYADSGKTLADVGTISWEERQCLIDIACSFGKVIEQKQIVVPPPTQRTTGVANTSTLRPGEAFNNDPNSIEDVKEILIANGWTQSTRDKNKWIRPGKKEHDGISATLGALDKHPLSLYVFSSNAYPFVERGLYSPFAVMTHLIFNGNWEECAKALRERGYGKTDSFLPTQSKDGEHDWKAAYRMAFDVIKVMNDDEFTESDINKVALAGKGLDYQKALGILKKIKDKNPHLVGHDNLKTEIARVKSYISNFYTVRRNVIKDEVVIKEKSESGTFSDKVSVDTLYVKLKENQYKVSKQDLDSILESDFVEEYNELKEYFYNLPPWDESQPDFIGMYSDYFKCNNAALQPFFKDMLKKHLVRAMRCAFGNIENRYILILGGEQDSGKSTYIRYLQPIDEYFIESDPTLMSQKDRMIALSTHFIWNIEEIDAYNSKNLAIVKEMISKQNERLRRPFGKREKRYIRIGNFFGTTNKDNFLSDETGNTRFLIFDGKITSFDYSNKKTGTEKIPIDRLWAQAYYLWSKGYECDLTTEEKNFRDNINVSYEVRNNIEELILKHFAPAKPMNHNGKQNDLYFWSNSDIEIFLQEVAPRMEGINKSISITSAFKRLNKQFEKEGKKFLEGMDYRFVMGRENNSRGKYLQPISTIASVRLEEIQRQSFGFNSQQNSSSFFNSNDDEQPF
jgi:hypothetical protein